MPQNQQYASLLIFYLLRQRDMREEQEESGMYLIQDRTELDSHGQLMAVRKRLRVVGYSHKQAYLRCGNEWEGQSYVVMAYHPEWLAAHLTHNTLQTAQSSARPGQMDYFFTVLEGLTQCKPMIQQKIDSSANFREKLASRYTEIRSELMGISKGDRCEMVALNSQTILCLFPSQIKSSLSLPLLKSKHKQSSLKHIIFLSIILGICSLMINWKALRATL